MSESSSPRPGLEIPVAILLFTFLFGALYQTVSLARQHSHFTDVERSFYREPLHQQVVEARMLNQKVEQLARGISALAPSNPAARRLAQEFHIPVAASGLPAAK